MQRVGWMAGWPRMRVDLVGPRAGERAAGKTRGRGARGTILIQCYVLSKQETPVRACHDSEKPMAHVNY
jgi:hypothetical protein